MCSSLCYLQTCSNLINTDCLKYLMYSVIGCVYIVCCCRLCCEHILFFFLPIFFFGAVLKLPRLVDTYPVRKCVSVSFADRISLIKFFTLKSKFVFSKLLSIYFFSINYFILKILKKC